MKKDKCTYLNPWLDVDGGDLLHNLWGGVQVNHSFVDPDRNKIRKLLKRIFLQGKFTLQIQISYQILIFY
jgi:hypothetical protein